VAEERGDREPVGQRADHRGLGEGADVADPRVCILLRAGDHEDDGGGEQQRECEPLHLPHRRLALEIARRHGLHAGRP
jgi:hypothetical protein